MNSGFKERSRLRVIRWKVIEATQYPLSDFCTYTQKHIPMHTCVRVYHITERESLMSNTKIRMLYLHSLSRFLSYYFILELWLFVAKGNRAIVIKVIVSTELMSSRYWGSLGLCLWTSYVSLLPGHLGQSHSFKSCGPVSLSYISIPRRCSCYLPIFLVLLSQTSAALPHPLKDSSWPRDFG